MSIVLGSVNTGTMLHGTIKATPFNQSRTVQTFFGLRGELHLQGRPHGRDLSAWLLPYGYSTDALLQTDIANMNALIGESGTLTWTFGALTTTYLNCIFLGFEMDEDPWLDGSGVNGWQVMGHMQFRHILQ